MAAYDQGIRGHPSHEPSFRYWGCFPWEWGCSHWDHKGGKGPLCGHDLGSQVCEHSCKPGSWGCLLTCNQESGGCVHCHNQGGRDCLCWLCLHPAANSQGQYAGPGKGGYQIGGKRPPILPCFLWGGTAGLPPGSPWGTNVPPPVTNREHVFGHSLGHSPQASTTMEEPAPVTSHPTPPVAPKPLGIKWQCPSPNPVASSPWSGDEVGGTSEEPPHLKWKDRMPLKKLLKGGWQEAFAKDSDLVQKARGPTLGQTTLILTVKYCTICAGHSSRWQTLQAFLNQTSMKFGMHELGGKIFTLPITLPKLHRKIYSSSAWWLQPNCQASWGWKEFIPQKPFAGGMTAHIAHGVPKKGKMRGTW